MITNETVTIYHKSLNRQTRLEEWAKYVYTAWIYGGKGANLIKGYESSNDITIRIPYTSNVDISNFSIGDIIYIGEGKDITAQSDLSESYNITILVNNNFGKNPHIRIGGK